MTEERPPRAGPASDTGPRRPGHPAVTRLALRVRHWAQLTRRHALLVRPLTQTTMEETRAALRRPGVRNAAPRYAAVLARERADIAKQARSL